MLLAGHVEEVRIDLNLAKHECALAEKRVDVQEFCASILRVHHRKRDIAPFLWHRGSDEEGGKRDVREHQRTSDESLVEKLVTAITTGKLIVVCNAECARLSHGKNELLRQWLD